MTAPENNVREQKPEIAVGPASGCGAGKGSLQKIVVPPGFVRNHPSQTAIMEPDEAAEYLLRLVEERTGKPIEQSRILDVGCGTRFASGIVNRELQVGCYHGIDIEKKMIDWLSRTVDDPRLEFVHWHVHNPVYQPDGTRMQEMDGFPLAGPYDIVTFFSVFTHLDPDDARTMLEFTRKALAPDGRAFLTVFISESENEYEEGDPDRPGLFSRYNRVFFERIIGEAGLEIVGQFPSVKLAAPQYVLAAR